MRETIPDQNSSKLSSSLDIFLDHPPAVELYYAVELGGR